MTSIKLNRFWWFIGICNLFWCFKNSGGYYVIEQARLQLHLVALNTNFYSEINHATAEDEAQSDPGGQWAWLVWKN